MYDIHENIIQTLKELLGKCVQRSIKFKLCIGAGLEVFQSFMLENLKEKAHRYFDIARFRPEERRH